MPWVKIDDHFDEHPKVASISPLGVALQVAALCYCNRNLTDGFVPRSVAKTLLDFDGLAFVSPTNDVGFGSGEDVQAKHVIELLVAADVWHAVPGGYQVHNFGLYQPTREDVLALREVRSDAGRKGGLAKAKQPAKQTTSNPRSKRKATAEAKSYPVPVPEDPMVKASGMGTAEGGSGGGAASPSSAIASGDADSAAPNPNGTPPPEAKAKLDEALGRIRSVPDSPPPRSRDEQLAALQASMAADDPQAPP